MTPRLASGLLALSLLFPPAGLRADPLPAGAEPADPLADVRTALVDADLAKALRLLDGHLARGDSPVEETQYLKGNSLALTKRYDEAIAVLSDLTGRFPKGAWTRKAWFKIADCHASKSPPDHAKAAAILERQVSDLVGPARKAEIAAFYLKFADEAFAPTARDAAGKPLPPRFAEALRFYQLAAEVGLPAGERQRAQLRMALCEMGAGKPAPAIARLTAFVKRHADDVTHRPEALYALGEAHAAAGHPADARAAWRDLADAVKGLKAGPNADRARELAGLAAVALYRISGTHTPSDKEGYAAYVKALNDFIAAYPEHSLVPQARYDIAAAAFALGRHEDAGKAFAKFIADHGRSPEIEYLDTARLTAGLRGQPVPAPAARTFLLPLARRQLGQSLAARKRFAEAVEVWQEFLAKHPGDGMWTAVQQEIVDAEYAVGAEALAAKRPDEARTAWDRFIAKYPLDPRVPGLYHAFAQMEFDAKRYAEAVAGWRLLVGKFPNTEEAGRGQYRIGLTLEVNLDKPEEAVEEYGRLTWSSWAERAKQRLGLMTRRELTVSTERSFRSDEKPVVKVFARNIAKLDVRVYKLDLSAYFRKQNTVLGVEFLDLGLIDPTAKFTHEVKGFAKLKPVEDGIEIPLDGVGVAAVTVGDDQLQATTLVIRSDLDILIKGGRGELLVYAQDMRTGKPFPGAEVLLGDGKEILPAGRTNADGVFRWKDKRLSTADGLSVFAVAGGHVAANAVGLKGLAPSQGLTARAHVYTDRAAYRPGQTVNYKAVLREVRDGAWAFTPGEAWTADVLDPAGRSLRSDTLRLSAFGAVNASFALDPGAPLGDYRIVLRKGDGPVFSGGFTVARYQLPKVQLKFEIPEPVYFRGEVVQGRITARHYYGEPVVGRAVQYSLGTGRTFTAVTDARGEIAFELDTRQFSETLAVPLSAAIPEDNAAVADSLIISTRGFDLSLSTVRDVYLAGERFDVAVSAADPKGKPVAGKLTVTLLRKEDRPGRGGDGETIVLTREIATDAKTGKAVVNLSAPRGGRHVVRVEGADRFGNVVSAERAVTVSGEDDTVKLRIIADTQTFRVGEKRAVLVHSRLPRCTALVTYEGEGVIGYELVTLLPGMNTLRFEVGHAHFPNFAVGVAVMQPGKLHTTRFEFAVERELRIALMPARTTLPPGGSLDLEVRVTDQAGRPVSAELSLALTDASLRGLYGDPSGGLKAVFGGQHRECRMRTVSSVGFAYSPATVRVAPPAGEDAVPVERGEKLARQQNELQTEFAAQASEIRSRNDLTRLRNLARQSLQTYNYINPRESVSENPNGWFAAVEGADASDGESLNYFANALTGDDRTLRVLAAKDAETAVDQLAKADEESSGGAGAGGLFSGSGQDFRAQGLFGGGGQRAGAGVPKPNERPDSPRADPAAPAPAAAVPPPPPGKAIREFFPETGYWNPAVVTDKDGRAKVRIDAPDSITRWVLSARGVDASAVTGEADVEIVTRKELFVELRLPGVLTAGDTFRPAARVHHLAGGARRVALSLEVRAANGLVLAKEDRVLDFAGSEIRDLAFAPLAAESGPLTITLSAAAGDLRDAAAKSVGVRPGGVRFVAHDAATTRNSATALLKLPEGRKYTDPALTVVVGPSVTRTLIDMALDIRPEFVVKRRPAGGGAAADESGYETVRIPADGPSSAAGDLLAIVFVSQYLATLPDGGGPDRAVLDGRLGRLVAALTVAQNADGGWSWCGADQPSEPWITARVMWALAAARNAGRAVDAATLDRGVAYLEQAYVRTPEADDQAKVMLLHALSEAAPAAGDRFAQANRLHRLRNGLGTAALAHLSLTLTNLDRKAMAAEVNQILLGRKKVVPRFDGPPAVFWPAVGSHAYLAADVEVTALALLAVQRVDPRDPAVEPAVRWLTAQRQGVRCTPDKATGLVVAGLGRYHTLTKFADDKYRLSVRVNGKEIGNAEVAAGSRTLAFAAPAAALAEGVNKVEILLDGNAEYSWSATLSGSAKAEDVDLSGGRLNIARRYEPARLEHAGRTVPRGFGVLTGTFPTWTNPLSQLPLGARAEPGPAPTAGWPPTSSVRSITAAATRPRRSPSTKRSPTVSPTPPRPSPDSPARNCRSTRSAPSLRRPGRSRPRRRLPPATRCSPAGCRT